MRTQPCSPLVYSGERERTIPAMQSSQRMRSVLYGWSASAKAGARATAAVAIYVLTLGYLAWLVSSEAVRRTLRMRSLSRRPGMPGRSRRISPAARGATLLLIAATLALGASVWSGQIAPVHAASSAPLLPGETLWSGVPSYLFGSQDSYDYAGANGFDQQPTMQAAVKAAGIPLIRTWFEQVDESDHTTPVSDAHQLALAQAVHNAGGVCLGNLTQPMTVAYALHLVTLLKGQCELYEVFNEPDMSGIWPPAVSVTSYLAFWTSFVPQARALDPQARFGGPATAVEMGMDGTYMQQTLQGMAASGVWPDFVSYHWYTCSTETAAQCLSETEPWFAGQGKTLVSWVQQYFPGKSVPVGITEWNANPTGGGYMDDDAWMAQYMAAALTGLEANPYLSFATQYDLGSYACFGSCDLWNVFPASGPPVARPEFTTLANEIARVSGTVTSPPPPTSTTTITTPPTIAPTIAPTATTTTTSGGVPAYDHVITILEENHGYSQIIGDTVDAPYINGTLITQGALATNYTANVASSLPNYLALTGGTDLGLTANCEPGPGCESSGPSIASEALAAGKTWKAYEENMTATCQNVVDGGLNNLYTIHHNPFPYYTGLAASCATNDVPYTQLASDLQSPNVLPAYVFITPNLNDDMHNGTIAQGDTWLSQQLPAIQASPACQQSRCLIAVVFDESFDATNEQVMAALLGPDVQAGARDATAYTHYNLLHTEELALGLPTMTANDAGAAPMAGMFTSGAGSTPPPPGPTPTPVPPAPPPTTPPPPPAGGTLFSDTFNSDAIGSPPPGWTVTSGIWTVLTDAQSGSPMLEQTNPAAGSYYISAGSPSWTDYTVQASVKPGNNNLNATTDLMGRYTDANNHYSLILKNGDEWWLGVKQGGNWTTLANGVFSYKAQWYTLALTFAGTKVTASLNGTVLASATDATFASGAIGFQANSNGELDNVTVTGAGSVTPPPPPPPPPSPTPIPPTPTPVPSVACVELVQGVMTAGQCAGTFTPASQPAPSGSAPCVEIVSNLPTVGACAGTFTPSGA